MKGNWQGYAYTAALTAFMCYGTWVSGCANAVKPMPDASPHIEQAATDIKEVVPLMDDATKQTKQIDTKVQKASPSLFPMIFPHTEAVRQDAAVAKEKAVTASADLAKANDATEKLKAAYGQLQADNDKLTASLAEAKQNNMKGVILLSVLTFIAGVGLAVYGNTKLGVALSAAGIAGAVLAVTLAQSAVLIGLGCGVILLAAIGWMTWKLVIERKATSELVATGEAVKAYLTPQQRAAVYGVGGAPGVADVLQSDSTQALVEQHRGVTGPGTVRLTPSLTPDGTVVPATAA